MTSCLTILAVHFLIRYIIIGNGAGVMGKLDLRIGKSFSAGFFCDSINFRQSFKHLQRSYWEYTMCQVSPNAANYGSLWA